MPDGDHVHPGLTRPYQKLYKQLCEGHFSAESLSQQAVAAVKEQLKPLGAAPVSLIASAAARLKQVPEEPLLRRLVDWTGESRFIDGLARQTLAPKRIIEPIVESAKELLLDFCIFSGKLKLRLTDA